MDVMRLPIISQKEVNANVFEVSFDASSIDFHFAAGQYVRITLDHLLYPDNKGAFRDFSISSSPKNHNQISVVFRNTGSGFKKTLLEMPLGESVSMRGPYGLMELPGDTTQDIVLVAGGIGITPFLSMMQYASESGYKGHIRLIYVNEERSNAIHTLKIDDLCIRNKNFSVIYKKNIFEGDFFQKEIAQSKNVSWYVAGSTAMVLATLDMLKYFKLPSKNIIFEEMMGYEKVGPLEESSAKNSEDGVVLLPQTKSNHPFSLSARKLNSIIETSGEGVIITDAEGIILYVNAEWQRITGWKSEDIVGKVTPRILKSGKVSPTEYEDLWKTIKSGEIARIDIVNKRKNGDFYYAEDVILPLKDDEGNVTEFVGFQRDVTDKHTYLSQFIDKSSELSEQNKSLENTKKAMLNLLEDAQELEKRLELEKVAISREKEKSEGILQFLRSIGDGVFAVDTDLNVIFMNTMAEKLSGYVSEDALGKKYTDTFNFVFEKDIDVSHADFVSQVIATGSISTLPSHTSIVKKDGSVVPVSDSAAPIRDASGVIVGCIVVFQDDTKKRELDQLKDSFISVAAHQLRTPLGGMRWSMESLLDEDRGKLPVEVRNELEQLYENSQRMVTLVNDLLNTTRIDGTVSKEAFESVDIVALLRKIVSDSLNEAKMRSVEVRFAGVYKKMARVFVAPKNMYEAFQNIIINAIKYNTTGGSVTINVHQKDNAFMHISIADTGIGIPAEQQSKMFVKFSRATNAVLKETDGSGLGLSVAKFFIEQSGGKIWFESEEGKGTTFFIDLPLTEK